MPLRKKCRIAGQSGTALLTVLVAVVLLGLAAAMAGQSLAALMQREREAELLWRGQQYRQAIASYYGARQGMYPAKLEDLLKDPRFPGTVRHLRRLYLDPMTGKEWQPVKDPAEKIIGVRSTSEFKPFQDAGFPKGLESFEGKTKYSDWEFVFTPEKKAAAQVPQGGKPRTPAAGGAPSGPQQPATR